MTEKASVQSDFDHWAIVELMGHVRMTGRLTEVELFGSKLGKLDVVDNDGSTVATQYFGGASVYRITACDEQTARDLARSASNLGPDVGWSLRRAIGEEAIAAHEKQTKQIEAAPGDDYDPDFEPDEHGPY